MKIQILRRIYEMNDLVDYTIHHLNNEIKSGGSGNKPNNFGVYENLVTQRVSDMFQRRYPNIEYKKLDFLIIMSSVYNDKLKIGFKNSRKK